MRAIFALLLVGCGGATPPPRAATAEPMEEPERTQVVETVEETTPVEAMFAEPSQEVCEQAMECCLAYVGEMNTLLPPGSSISAEEACAGVQAVRDLPPENGVPACETMIESWRQALLALQRPVPAACGGGARSAAGPA